jgi:hypothetical protein
MITGRECLVGIMFRFYLIIILLLPLFGLAKADDSSDESRYSWETEIDPYYSNLGLYLNLADEPIPDLGDKTEDAIYQDLLFRSHKPRFILLEFSVNPMPILGAYLRKHQEDFYQDAELREDLNFVEVLTAGFEEPYAVSLFMGNMVTYGGNGEKEGKNKGFMGYLLSHGDKHLLNNEVIDDNWYEFEWKIKGKIARRERNLEWSFRVGAKWHENEFIADSMYVGVRRDHFDIQKEWLSFLENSGVDVYMEFSQDERAPTQQRILAHKNFPLKNSKRMFKLAFGFIRTSNRRYQLPLQENTDVQLAIIPSIKF